MVLKRLEVVGLEMLESGSNQKNHVSVLMSSSSGCLGSPTVSNALLLNEHVEGYNYSSTNYTSWERGQPVFESWY